MTHEELRARGGFCGGDRKATANKSGQGVLRLINGRCFRGWIRIVGNDVELWMPLDPANPHAPPARGTNYPNPSMTPVLHVQIWETVYWNGGVWSCRAIEWIVWDTDTVMEPADDTPVHPLVWEWSRGRCPAVDDRRAGKTP